MSHLPPPLLHPVPRHAANDAQIGPAPDTADAAITERPVTVLMLPPDLYARPELQTLIEVGARPGDVVIQYDDSWHLVRQYPYTAEIERALDSIRNPSTEPPPASGRPEVDASSRRRGWHLRLGSR